MTRERDREMLARRAAQRAIAAPQEEPAEDVVHRVMFDRSEVFLTRALQRIAAGELGSGCTPALAVELKRMVGLSARARAAHRTAATVADRVVAARLLQALWSCKRAAFFAIASVDLALQRYIFARADPRREADGLGPLEPELAQLFRGRLDPFCDKVLLHTRRTLEDLVVELGLQYTVRLPQVDVRLWLCQ